MIDLNTFLSSIIADATKGQANADRLSGEIALMYKENELLKYFSAPRISISSVDFECNMAILGYQNHLEIPEEAGKKFKSEVSAFLDREFSELPESKAILEKGRILPDVVKKLKSTYKISETAQNILDNIRPEYFLTDDYHNNFSPALSGKIVESFLNTVNAQNPIMEADKKSLQASLNDHLKQFTKKWWDDYVKINPQIVKEKIPLIAVESKELSEIPSEKMTKAKIHLEIRPYEWTSMEVEDADKNKIIKYKLVPE